MFELASEKVLSKFRTIFVTLRSISIPHKKAGRNYVKTEVVDIVVDIIDEDSEAVMVPQIQQNIPPHECDSILLMDIEMHMPSTDVLYS